MKDYSALELYGNNRNKYILYCTGHKTKLINGVGIIVAANRNVIFEPTSDRICKMTTQINDIHKFVLISTDVQLSKRAKKIQRYVTNL